MNQQQLGLVRNADSLIPHPRSTEQKSEQIPGDVYTPITAYLSKSSWFLHTCQDVTVGMYVAGTHTHTLSTKEMEASAIKQNQLLLQL